MAKQASEQSFSLLHWDKNCSGNITVTFCSHKQPPMLPACVIPTAGQVASNLEAQMPGDDESSLLGHFLRLTHGILPPCFDPWTVFYLVPPYF